MVLRLKECNIAAPVTDVPHAEVNVLDGDRAEIVQAIPDGTRTTFDKYANNVILPAVRQELLHVDRLAILWDVYNKDCLKLEARKMCGIGATWKVVMGNMEIPSDWKSFLILINTHY